jgi:hypothetical protein
MHRAPIHSLRNADLHPMSGILRIAYTLLVNDRGKFGRVRRPGGSARDFRIQKPSDVQLYAGQLVHVYIGDATVTVGKR